MKYRVNLATQKVERADKVESRIALVSVFIALIFGLIALFTSVWWLLAAGLFAFISIVFILKAIDSFGVNQKHDGYNEGYEAGTGVDLSATDAVQFINED